MQAWWLFLPGPPPQPRLTVGGTGDQALICRDRGGGGPARSRESQQTRLGEDAPASQSPGTSVRQSRVLGSDLS